MARSREGGEDLVIDGKVDRTIELPQHALTGGVQPAGSRRGGWSWFSAR